MTKLCGHSKVMMSFLKSYEERIAWEEILSNPFPKLLSGFLPASVVSYELSFTGFLENFGLKSPDEWMIKMGVPVVDGRIVDPKARDYPISGRFYKHSNVNNIDLEKGTALEKLKNDETRQMEVELQAIGLPVVCFLHKLEGREFSERCLFLPHMKISDKQDDAFLKRDIDGAAIFLAYLLDKKLVQESEIPKNDVDEHGRYNRWMGFGPIILTMAKRILSQQGEGLKDKLANMKAAGVAI